MIQLLFAPPPTLSLTLLRLRFSLQRPNRLIHFPGSAWRGALGHQLRHIACLTGAPECTGCTQRFACAYSYLFETPVAEEKTLLSNYQDAPAPYVLHEQQTDDASLILHCALIGRASAQRSLMHQALVRAGNSELGVAGRTLRWQQTDAWCEQQSKWQPLDPLTPSSTSLFCPAIPPIPNSVLKITFVTPLRMRRQGQNVRPDNFSFADWFGNTLRRLSLLSEFHEDQPIQADFAGLMQAAKGVVLQYSDLRWVEQTRHSARQGTDMKLGGLVGDIHVMPSALEPFWPYLWLGQFTHIGRATTMGLGRYLIEAASLPSHPALR